MSNENRSKITASPEALKLTIARMMKETTKKCGVTVNKSGNFTPLTPIQKKILESVKK